MGKKLEYIIHFVFWIFYGFMLVFPLIFSIRIMPEHVYWVLGETFLMGIINFYVFYTFISPYLLFRNNKTRFFITSLAFITGFTILRHYIVIIIYHGTDFSLETTDYRLGVFIRELLSSIFITGFSIFIKITIDWVRNQKMKAELQNQNQSSELALLRSQINPHFLFNTLNNIYYLTYRKEDMASDAVMKLSEIMRYMLNEANAEKVLLEKEIEYLKGFIDLQHLRGKADNFAEFNITGNTRGILISPMLFIPFVENAFKHGSKKVVPPGIIIDLKTEDSTIVFKITNYLQKEEQNKSEEGGIGLKNVKRRLELLYPSKHIVTIKKTEETFFVKLSIEV